MTVLITGGCGYKGSVLVPKLLKKNHKVRVVDIMWFGNFLQPHSNLEVIRSDIRNIQDKWFEDVDAIIHLASVANDPCCELNPKLTWEVSALSTMQLADKAVKKGVKKFIYASSGSVYGVSSESQVTEDAPLNPISEYNKAKMVAERVLLSYSNELIIQIVRPATVCGYSPRMRFDVSVNMLTIQALTKKLITVFGGNQTRPNIHIDDITDLYLYLLDKNISGIFNAGFENLSILEIAKQVTSSINAEIKITMSNDPRSYHINSDKLLKIGFKPMKSVQDAINELIQYYQQGTLRDEDRFYNIRTMKNIPEVFSG
ncbi:MAG: NAD-dependent epimerase/dehydratase:3-beta hydroxysteroid dehydrogenase/isomerase:Polysaccharide biosynthesis protein CapD:dTDP-4-dehydrorhamnose reductase [uncultured bacterium]|nr:MAG: NAD-dependent epimerase/dehydratase:3-beta hydroxysteroid dehydrogenase/isomerase:Polysaccharide biosynthesis protein CapD:dTDP-4-dehydrorhamnose reductase [uncultured bacterium]